MVFLSVLEFPRKFMCSISIFNTKDVSKFDFGSQNMYFPMFSKFDSVEFFLNIITIYFSNDNTGSYKMKVIKTRNGKLLSHLFT